MAFNSWGTEKVAGAGFAARFRSAGQAVPRRNLEPLLSRLSTDELGALKTPNRSPRPPRTAPENSVATLRGVEQAQPTCRER